MIGGKKLEEAFWKSEIMHERCLLSLSPESFQVPLSMQSSVARESFDSFIPR